MLKSECDKIHNDLSSLLYNVPEIKYLKYIWEKDYSIYEILTIGFEFNRVVVRHKDSQITIEYEFQGKDIGINLLGEIKDVVNSVVYANNKLRNYGLKARNKDKGIS